MVEFSSDLLDLREKPEFLLLHEFQLACKVLVFLGVSQIFVVELAALSSMLLGYVLKFGAVFLFKGKKFIGYELAGGYWCVVA